VLSKIGPDASVRLSWTVSSSSSAHADLRLGQVLEEVGRVPLPPYMKREADKLDLATYQVSFDMYWVSFDMCWVSFGMYYVTFGS
jgi:S-adenosylmethionine:tRNA-ribosyltransferase-isomerase (queuine synthetase)